MRSRAYRRHKRAVKLARRYRICRAMIWTHPDIDAALSPRVMHWHLRCSCWSVMETRPRRREERAWRRDEL